MGKEIDLLKFVKCNDIEKVQKLLIPSRRHDSSNAKSRKDREVLERDRNRLLDLRWKEKINHVNINCHEDDTGYTPLILAVLNGNRELAMLLIHFNADVNARDNKGNTALHVATFNGRSDMIELLLQCGAEVDTFNHDRNTPVHIACQNCIPGTKFILLKLLRAQPDLLAKNKDGATPFDLSAQYGRIDAVALLLDHEPAFRTSSRAFIDSCIRGHKDVVRLMLDYGIDPDIEDPYHNSCGLHEACRFLRIDVVTLLISHGADPEKFNSKEESVKTILASYPAEKIDVLLRIFEEWKGKPKLRPRFCDTNSNGEDTQDIKALYPLLKNDVLWTKLQTSYCNSWMKSSPHTNLLDKFSKPEEKPRKSYKNVYSSLSGTMHWLVVASVKTILASYPAEKIDVLLRIFEEWKGKPKLRPRFCDTNSNGEDTQDIKALYPLLKNDVLWTKLQTSYCNSWMKSSPHTNLLDNDPCTLCVIPCKFSSFVIFDFGRPFILSGIRILGWDSDQMPKRCQLQKAEGLDGPWETVRIFICKMQGSKDPLKPGEPQEYHGFKETSQYWKLLIKDNHGGDIISLHSIHFYGVDPSVIEFFENLDMAYCSTAFIEKGFNRKEDLTKITTAIVNELVDNEEDRWKLLEAVGQERKIVSRLKRRSELDVMFSELQQMLHI
ncbi:uncharacterized protein LOC111624819 [Centruroides sculpturatus]|uniref:uncharacterized protein LOC111624819 n=2 Tax=Centruroides sculpturatus TaxID=218467 RepID=UPI000C6D61D6|nr:uncharacterized protein LOC111624819 [Centruroides sculpturatus]